MPGVPAPGFFSVISYYEKMELESARMTSQRSSRDFTGQIRQGTEMVPFLDFLL